MLITTLSYLASAFLDCGRHEEIFSSAVEYYGFHKPCTLAVGMGEGAEAKQVSFMHDY